MVYFCMLASCFCLLPIGSVRNGIWEKEKWFNIASELIRALYIFCVLMIPLLCWVVTW